MTRLGRVVRVSWHALFADLCAGRVDVQPEIRRLDMGDVLIQPADGPGPAIIVERKHVTDAVSSAFDGRLEEQWSRLVQWQDQHRLPDGVPNHLTVWTSSMPRSGWCC